MKKSWILIVIFLLSGCAYTNHGRDLSQEIITNEGGLTIVVVEVLIEKSGTETSEATQNTDADTSLTGL